MLARAVVIAVMALAILAQAALADATPVQLLLLYVPNVSNTGTTAASGIAELVMPEGEVRVTAADLPHLDGDKVYVAWVVNSGTNAFQLLGSFNAAEGTDAVHYETVLPDAIPDHQWNLLLLTIENNADVSHPSQRHSIAGVFPRADNEPLPGVLPNTGGDTPLAASCGTELSVVSSQLSPASLRWVRLAREGRTSGPHADSGLCRRIRLVQTTHPTRARGQSLIAQGYQLIADS
jgi:hypothetical protein